MNETEEASDQGLFARNNGPKRVHDSAHQNDAFFSQSWTREPDRVKA